MARFDSEEAAKKLAEKALDEILYKGKSIREWMQIIGSEDCISRKEVLKIFGDDIHPLDYRTNGYVNAIEKLPPVMNKTVVPRNGSMAVKELIEALQGLDPSMSVIIDGRKLKSIDWDEYYDESTGDDYQVVNFVLEELL